jgi:FlaA1/EpsC-like NDP-sugar epimerase
MKKMQELQKELLRPSQTKRFFFFFILDILIISAALYISFFIYFDASRNVRYSSLVGEVLPYFLLAKLAAFALLGTYRSTWRYFGIGDLFNVIIALALAALVLILLSLVPQPESVDNSFWKLLSPVSTFPKSIVFIDFSICLILVSLLRISKRFYLEIVRERKATRRGKRTIIIGAGNTGEMILRDMARNGLSEFHPIGFLDDDRAKTGVSIHSIRVLGSLGDLERTIWQYRIEAMIVAIPSLNHEELRKLYKQARKLDVSTVKIVPRIYHTDKPEINLKTLEDISIEDLIGRQSVTVDSTGIARFLSGRTVLITGAGGSIGSEIVVQVCGYGPKKIILFDIDETDLHNLGLRLDRLFPEHRQITYFITGDVRDRVRVDEVFAEHEPEIVFHAAAYKHVPMMEHNPGEAVKVNLFGTYAVAQASVDNHVEKFIMISSDKAVRPTSVMGATKRLAEYVCKAFNDISNLSTEDGGAETVSGSDNGYQDPEAKTSDLRPQTSSTRFVSVRFGNVLGSRGSVIPLFLDQLKHGGPITVTHPEMKRYFMTIPEAVTLVLQASFMGNGGDILVLDMGDPVKIIDIAEELVIMHGLEPHKDIGIQYTGLRPGEKLFEEILTAEEGTDASRHEKIFVAKNGQSYSNTEMLNILEEFQTVLSTASTAKNGIIKGLLRKYVKYYEEETN